MKELINIIFPSAIPYLEMKCTIHPDEFAKNVNEFRKKMEFQITNYDSRIVKHDVEFIIDRYLATDSVLIKTYSDYCRHSYTYQVTGVYYSDMLWEGLALDKFRDAGEEMADEEPNQYPTGKGYYYLETGKDIFKENGLMIMTRSPI